MMQQKTKKITVLGLLFAMACTLSFLESLIPTTGLLPPGVKLGLSNIVPMFAMLFLGFRSAWTIAILKSAFVLLMRGAVAGFMSISGGMVSLLIMGILVYSKKLSFTLQFVSICGAVGHNLRQLAASSFLLTSFTTFAYAPILIISGIVMGLITSAVLFVLLPTLKRICTN